MQNKTTLWISALVFAVAVFSLTSFSVAAEDEKKGVKAAVDEFYSALNVLFTGDAEPMKALWSHADDVTYMGPGGGLQAGWEQVGKEWDVQAALKLGGKVEPAQMHMIVGNDIAVTSNFEEGENTNAKGEVQKVSIRATNIFRKEDGKWKMIGHHTDLLPYLAK